ncbi:CAAX protease [Clostridium botulinum C/D str. BKT12695]|nr:CAAX protease [Clostridium botulinum C/D str. BKT12695]
MRENRVFSANLFGMILLILFSIAPTVLVPVFKTLSIPRGWDIVVLQVVLLLMPTIIYFIITKQSVKEVLRLKKINLKSVFIIIIIAFVAQPITVFLSLITQFIFPNKVGMVISQLNTMPLILQVAIVALTPAILEEVTMRGIILSGYKNIDIKKAAIMTGLFFCMLHRDGNQSLYTFAFGILFAYLVEITGSIFSSMICHFTINGTQVVLASIFTKIFSGKSGGEELYGKGIHSIPYSQLIIGVVVWFIIAAICFKILMIFIKKLIKVNKYEQINNNDEYIQNEKILNWPFYVSLVIYIITIIIEIVSIYK